MGEAAGRAIKPHAHARARARHAHTVWNRLGQTSARARAGASCACAGRALVCRGGCPCAGAVVLSAVRGRARGHLATSCACSCFSPMICGRAEARVIPACLLGWSDSVNRGAIESGTMLRQIEHADSWNMAGGVTASTWRALQGAGKSGKTGWVD
jgi:hypothetical protein